MKKLLAGLLAVFMLTACSSGGGSTEPTKTESFKFSFNDTEVTLGAEAANIISGLGAQQSECFEEKSCAFNGYDRTYYFSGVYVITAQSDGGTEKIASIRLMDDTVSTTEGVSIGDKKAKVEEAYGKEGKEDGSTLTYTKGDTTLTFAFEGEDVSSITYGSISTMAGK